MSVSRRGARLDRLDAADRRVAEACIEVSTVWETWDQVPGLAREVMLRLLRTAV